MNGHAPSIHSLRHEESATLLEEKSPSDIESDAGRADLDSRFTDHRRIWLSQAKAYISNLRPASSCRSSLLRIAIFLLPSFVQYRLRSSNSSSNHNRRNKYSNSNLDTTGGNRSSTPHPTAYLDGMRGLAALFVFFCHYFYTCFVIAQGYGYGAGNYHFLKLPIIRLFYQGPPMVCVFFVISGYALSLKPLKLMRARRFDSLVSTMSSLVFRRVFRLFLPTAISTLLIMALLRVGAYEWTREFAYDDVYMRNVQEIHYDRMNSTGEQLADWGTEMFRFVHVWDWDSYQGSTAIDVHLWTIPVEFRSSMVLFLTLLGSARLRTGWRFGFLAVVMVFVYASQRWEMLLFYCGMVLAEVDVIRGVHGRGGGGCEGGARQGEAGERLPVVGGDEGKKGSRGGADTGNRRARLGRAMWMGVSILALYLMSQPDQGGEETPGWVFLTNLVPEWYKDTYRYWQSAGAVLMVLAVGRSPAWQSFFNSAVVQYLGKISYAIYLMHGPVMHTIGYAIERWMWSMTGIEGNAYNWGFVLASFFIVPVVVWISDIFWRAVDAPVVRFAKWLEARCSISE